MGRRTLVLVIALALAGLAGFAVFQFLTNVEDEARSEVDEVRVYRAVNFIEAGAPGESVNNPDFIVEATELAEYVRDNTDILCLGPVDVGSAVDPTVCDTHAKSLDDLLTGTLAAGPISAGQIITEDMFVSPAEANSAKLSEDIEEGRVAIGINPSTVQSAGGFIRPGDRVNLVASSTIQVGNLPQVLADPTLRDIFAGVPVEDPGPTIPGQDEPSLVDQFAAGINSSLDFTQTFEQDIKVLAVGADTERVPLGSGLTPQPDQIIVLEVTPEQAERIEWSRQFASVTLMLLPDPEENTYTPFEARGVLTEDVFGIIDRIIELIEQVEAGLGT